MGSLTAKQILIASVLIQIVIFLYLATSLHPSSLKWAIPSIRHVSDDDRLAESEADVHSSLTIRRLYKLAEPLGIPNPSSCESSTGMAAMIAWDRQSRCFVKDADGVDLLQCRVTHLQGQPIASQPHTICNSTGLMIDVKALTPASCPLHRPAYQCDGPATFHHYTKGAFSWAQPCTRQPSFQLEQFPRDHLRDIFDSFECRTDRFSTDVVTRLDGVTLFVTRERGEHFNLFHAATDWLNAFAVIALLNVPLDQIAIVILDDHAPSNLDIVWDVVFSRRRPTARLSAYKSTVIVDQAVFVPPGYSSFLYKDNSDGLSCNADPEGVGLMNAFSEHVLKSFGIVRRSIVTANPVTNLLLITRKPYIIGSFQHKFVGRQFDNEPEIVAALERVANFNVTVADFSELSLEKQLQLVSTSDIMIGMHGAGLLHAFWLPRNGALLEIRPSPEMGWRCFKNIALQVGVRYDDYVNDQFPNDYREDQAGDYTRVDTKRLVDKVLRLQSQMFPSVEI